MKKLRSEMINRVMIFLSIVSISFVSCKTIKEKQMLKKAVDQGVPETSKWVGGKDGGEWVNFIFTQDSIFHIDTYNDYTNEFACRFTYKVTCPSVQEKEIRKAFKFTNGMKVFWKENNEVVTSCLEFKEKIDKQ